MFYLRKKRLTIRLIAWIVLCLFCWTDAVKSQPFSVAPVLTPSLETLHISNHLGNVNQLMLQEKAFNPSKTVIQIQDSHANYEAQNRIQEILKQISNNPVFEAYDSVLVAVEAASGLLDPEKVFGHPNKELEAGINKLFLKEGKVSGAELFALNSKKKVTLFGVEDPELYKKNLKAFQHAHQIKKEVQSSLDVVRNSLSQIQAIAYPKPLLNLVLAHQQYLEGNRSFKEYLSLLEKSLLDSKLSSLSENYPQFLQTLEVFSLEKKIDFKKVDKERRYFLKELEKRLVQEDRQQFVEKSLLFRLGQTSAVQYYRFIKSLVQSVYRSPNAVWQRYPGLFFYIESLELHADIDGLALYKEVEQLTQEVKQNWLTDLSVVELDQLETELKLLTKLISLEMSRDDLKELQRIQSGLNLKAWQESLEIVAWEKPEVIQEVESLKLKLSSLKALFNQLDQFERFYELALQRDEAMSQRLLQQMSKTKKSVVFLVSGGFHTEGLNQVFSEKGFSYAVVSPRMVQADSSLYLKQILNVRTPFERALLRSGNRLGVELLSANQLMTQQAKENLQLLKAEKVLQYVSWGAYLSLNLKDFFDQINDMIRIDLKTDLVAELVELKKDPVNAILYGLIQINGDPYTFFITDQVLSPELERETLKGKAFPIPYREELVRYIVPGDLRERVQKEKGDRRLMVHRGRSGETASGATSGISKYGPALSEDQLVGEKGFNEAQNRLISLVLTRWAQLSQKKQGLEAEQDKKYLELLFSDNMQFSLIAPNLIGSAAVTYPHKIVFEDVYFEDVGSGAVREGQVLYLKMILRGELPHLGRGESKDKRVQFDEEVVALQAQLEEFISMGQDQQSKFTAYYTALRDHPLTKDKLPETNLGPFVELARKARGDLSGEAVLWGDMSFDEKNTFLKPYARAFVLEHFPELRVAKKPSLSIIENIVRINPFTFFSSEGIYTLIVDGKGGVVSVQKRSLDQKRLSPYTDKGFSSVRFKMIQGVDGVKNFALEQGSIALLNEQIQAAITETFYWLNQFRNQKKTFNEIDSFFQEVSSKDVSDIVQAIFTFPLNENEYQESFLKQATQFAQDINTGMPQKEYELIRKAWLLVAQRLFTRIEKVEDVVYNRLPQIILALEVSQRDQDLIENLLVPTEGGARLSRRVNKGEPLSLKTGDVFRLGKDNYYLVQAIEKGRVRLIESVFDEEQDKRIYRAIDHSFNHKESADMGGGSGEEQIQVKGEGIESFHIRLSIEKDQLVLESIARGSDSKTIVYFGKTQGRHADLANLVTVAKNLIRVNPFREVEKNKRLVFFVKENGLISSIQKEKVGAPLSEKRVLFIVKEDKEGAVRIEVDLDMVSALDEKGQATFLASIQFLNQVRNETLELAVADQMLSSETTVDVVVQTILSYPIAQEEEQKALLRRAEAFTKKPFGRIPEQYYELFRQSLIIILNQVSPVNKEIELKLNEIRRNLEVTQRDHELIQSRLAPSVKGGLMGRFLGEEDKGELEQGDVFQIGENNFFLVLSVDETRVRFVEYYLNREEKRGRLRVVERFLEESVALRIGSGENNHYHIQSLGNGIIDEHVELSRNNGGLFIRPLDRNAQTAVYSAVVQSVEENEIALEGMLNELKQLFPKQFPAPAPSASDRLASIGYASMDAVLYDYPEKGLVFSGMPRSEYYSNGSVWAGWRGGEGLFPDQGWKIHVASTLRNSAAQDESLMTVVTEYLRLRDIDHKVHRVDKISEHAQSEAHRKGGLRQSIKLVTVYPENRQAAIEIAADLEWLVQQEKIPADPKKIQGEKRIFEKGYVHFRYGRLRGGDFGDSDFIIDPRDSKNRIYDDRENYQVPSWDRDIQDEVIKLYEQLKLEDMSGSRIGSESRIFFKSSDSAVIDPDANLKKLLIIEEQLASRFKLIRLLRQSKKTSVLNAVAHLEKEAQGLLAKISEIKRGLSAYFQEDKIFDRNLEILERFRKKQEFKDLIFRQNYGDYTYLKLALNEHGRIISIKLASERFDPMIEQKFQDESYTLVHAAVFLSIQGENWAFSNGLNEKQQLVLNEVLKELNPKEELELHESAVFEVDPEEVPLDFGTLFSRHVVFAWKGLQTKSIKDDSLSRNLEAVLKKYLTIFNKYPQFFAEILKQHFDAEFVREYEQERVQQESEYGVSGKYLDESMQAFVLEYLRVIMAVESGQPKELLDPMDVMGVRKFFYRIFGNFQEEPFNAQQIDPTNIFLYNQGHHTKALSFDSDDMVILSAYELYSYSRGASRFFVQVRYKGKELVLMRSASHQIWRRVEVMTPGWIAKPLAEHALDLNPLLNERLDQLLVAQPRVMEPIRFSDIDELQEMMEAAGVLASVGEFENRGLEFERYNFYGGIGRKFDRGGDLVLDPDFAKEWFADNLVALRQWGEASETQTGARLFVSALPEKVQTGVLPVGTMTMGTMEFMGELPKGGYLLDQSGAFEKIVPTTQMLRIGETTLRFLVKKDKVILIPEDGSGLLFEHVLKEGVYNLGRALKSGKVLNDIDVTFPDPTISQKHLTLKIKKGPDGLQVFASDLNSTNGVVVLLLDKPIELSEELEETTSENLVREIEDKTTHFRVINLREVVLQEPSMLAEVIEPLYEVDADLRTGIVEAFDQSILKSENETLKKQFLAYVLVFYVRNKEAVKKAVEIMISDKTVEELGYELTAEMLAYIAQVRKTEYELMVKWRHSLQVYYSYRLPDLGMNEVIYEERGREFTLLDVQLKQLSLAVLNPEPVVESSAQAQADKLSEVLGAGSLAEAEKTVGAAKEVAAEEVVPQLDVYVAGVVRELRELIAAEDGVSENQLEFNQLAQYILLAYSQLSLDSENRIDVDLLDKALGASAVDQLIFFILVFVTTSEWSFFGSNPYGEAPQKIKQLLDQNKYLEFKEELIPFLAEDERFIPLFFKELSLDSSSKELFASVVFSLLSDETFLREFLVLQANRFVEKYKDKLEIKVVRNKEVEAIEVDSEFPVLEEPDFKVEALFLKQLSLVVMTQIIDAIRKTKKVPESKKDPLIRNLETVIKFAPKEGEDPVAQYLNHLLTRIPPLVERLKKKGILKQRDLLILASRSEKDLAIHMTKLLSFYPLAQALLYPEADKKRLSDLGNEEDDGIVAQLEEAQAELTSEEAQELLPDPDSEEHEKNPVFAVITDDEPSVDDLLERQDDDDEVVDEAKPAEESSDDEVIEIASILTPGTSPVSPETEAGESEAAEVVLPKRDEGTESAEEIELVEEPSAESRDDFVGSTMEGWPIYGADLPKSFESSDEVISDEGAEEVQAVEEPTSQPAQLDRETASKASRWIDKIDWRLMIAFIFSVLIILGVVFLPALFKSSKKKSGSSTTPTTNPEKKVGDASTGTLSSETRTARTNPSTTGNTGTQPTTRPTQPTPTKTEVEKPTPRVVKVTDFEESQLKALDPIRARQEADFVFVLRTKVSESLANQYVDIRRSPSAAFRTMAARFQQRIAQVATSTEAQAAQLARLENEREFLIYQHFLEKIRRYRRYAAETYHRSQRSVTHPNYIAVLRYLGAEVRSVTRSQSYLDLAAQNRTRLALTAEIEGLDPFKGFRTRLNLTTLLVSRFGSRDEKLSLYRLIRRTYSSAFQSGSTFTPDVPRQQFKFLLDTSFEHINGLLPLFERLSELTQDQKNRLRVTVEELIQNLGTLLRLHEGKDWLDTAQIQSMGVSKQTLENFLKLLPREQGNKRGTSESQQGGFLIPVIDISGSGSDLEALKRYLKRVFSLYEANGDEAQLEKLIQPVLERLPAEATLESRLSKENLKELMGGKYSELTLSVLSFAELSKFSTYYQNHIPSDPEQEISISDALVWNDLLEQKQLIEEELQALLKQYTGSVTLMVKVDQKYATQAQISLLREKVVSGSYQTELGHSGIMANLTGIFLRVELGADNAFELNLKVEALIRSMEPLSDRFKAFEKPLDSIKGPQSIRAVESAA